MNSESDGRTICTFCGRSRSAVRTLVAGALTCICDGCIDSFLAPGAAHTIPRSGHERCSFCARRQHTLFGSANSAWVCRACLETCHDLAAGDTASGNDAQHGTGDARSAHEQAPGASDVSDRIRSKYYPRKASTSAEPRLVKKHPTDEQ
jgi:hypothetical protein